MTDSEGEFWVQDRTQKIRQVVGQYGEDNFCISFSGGKDSCVLSRLVDEALPNNTIPRLYVNTGIEYNFMVKFVRKLAQSDNRIVIISASVNIKKMLDEQGYPFKSKEHSLKLGAYQSMGKMTPWLEHYTASNGRFGCPKCLLYQFTPEFHLKVSDKCCYYLKKKPIQNWQKENNKPWTMTGLMREEGGNRSTVNCITQKRGVNKFHPLSVMTKEWEDWYIASRGIELCELYYPPYNFQRTGCKGCPFSLKLQEQLDVMSELLPAEKKQCERIWEPVYSEYRERNYRLKSQISFSDILGGG